MELGYPQGPKAAGQGGRAEERTPRIAEKPRWLSAGAKRQWATPPTSPLIQRQHHGVQSAHGGCAHEEPLWLPIEEQADGTIKYTFSNLPADTTRLRAVRL